MDELNEGSAACQIGKLLSHWTLNKGPLGPVHMFMTSAENIQSQSQTIGFRFIRVCF